ncbi:class I glutamine amidotransferase-like protein [Astrocystis sublimbata]|nr:class I glutamine amidotransferase-like protein [Astrocystis sublimbata]
MAQPLNLSKPHRKIHVGVLLMKGETELLDIAPVDMISALTRRFVDSLPDDLGPPGFKDGALDIEVHWVTEDGPSVPAKLTAGMRVVPTDDFTTCPPLDIVLVGAAPWGYVPSAAELAFARKAYTSCAAFLAICGGVDIPRRAGLLDGKTATGPSPIVPMWVAEQSQSNEGGGVGQTNWVEKRWVRDGKMWTSGALLNGADMVHNFARQTWGGDSATGWIVNYLATLGAWPDRDVDFKDVDFTGLV